MVGREVLIKVVLQAIPAYIMMVFKVPHSITRKIEQLINKFWWSQEEEKNKIHWVAWDMLTKNKRE